MITSAAAPDELRSADTNIVSARLSSVLRVADLRSRADRLSACDESLSLIAADVEQLTKELDRVRAGASPLVQSLAERDALLTEKELELTRLENERLLAQRRGEDATAALRETRDLLEKHDGRVTNATRELNCLRSTLAERDSLLIEKELELTRLENERLQALRNAEDASAALRESRDLFEEQAGRIETSRRELEELRSRLAERDRQLEEAERERSCLDEALAEKERAAVADLQVRARSTVDAFDDRATAHGHVLFAPFPEGYRLVGSDRPCPHPGEVVDAEGRSFVVARVGRSPLPTDDRSCAFLQLRVTAN